MTEKALGIDIGSTTLKLCLLARDGTTEQAMLAHEGNLPATLNQLLDSLGTKDFTGVKGVDVILDVIGGDYLARNVAAVAVKGCIVQVGVMGGGEVTFPLGGLMPKRATLIGTVLRSRPLEEKIAITRRFAEEILPLFDAGDLRPVIDSRFEVTDIVDAHRYMESNANVGKILIDFTGAG